MSAEQEAREHFKIIKQNDMSYILEFDGELLDEYVYESDATAVKEDWVKRMAAFSSSQTARLREALQNVIEASINDADRCTICLNDPHQHSDGRGTQVVNIDTGEPLPNVRAVDVHIQTADITSATIEVFGVEVVTEG